MRIDINCDVGEGVGNEKELFPLISSCNIACGGHAGDNKSMNDIVQLAIAHDVKIGAHPSYPDKENFGRTSISIAKDVLLHSIQEQVEALLVVVKKHKASISHIKPHGALYNDIAKDKKKALIFLEAILPYKEMVLLFVPYGSIIEKVALKNGFKVKKEAFADRNYNEDLSLVSRTHKNSVIEEPEKVFQHLLQMIENNKVITHTGLEVNMNATTFCIHGDTKFALQILTYLTKELSKQYIFVKNE